MGIDIQAILGEGYAKWKRNIMKVTTAFFALILFGVIKISMLDKAPIGEIAFLKWSVIFGVMFVLFTYWLHKHYIT